MGVQGERTEREQRSNRDQQNGVGEVLQAVG